MEIIKRERAVLRRAFTKAANIFKSKLDEQTEENIQLTIAYNCLNTQADKIIAIEERMKLEWLKDENFDEEAFTQDYETGQEYVYRHRFYRWVELRTLYEKILTPTVYCEPQATSHTTNSSKTIRGKMSIKEEASKQSSSSSDEENSNTKKQKKRKFKLPKIELRRFDGKICNWMNFWGQFRKIHEDNCIDDDDKFQYLMQATESGSAARKIVDSFPPSGENYNKAIDLLKSRFARDELLIETYVRELLELVLIRKTLPKEENLSSFYDKLVAQLRALETLNVTTDKYAAMLLPLVESALPKEILQTWTRSLHLLSDEEERQTNQLASLLKFLKLEVENEERIAITRSGFSNFENNEEPNTSKNIKGKVPTASCIISGEKKKVKICLWCDKDTHNSTECYKASGMTIDEKRDMIKKKRACFICLKIGHSFKRCKCFVKCLLCSKRHTTIMCPERTDSREKEDKKPELQINKPEVLLCHPNAITLLPTIKVRIKNPFGYIVVRALIDSGAQRSYITKDLATELQLKPISRETLGHFIFGGTETKQEVHNVYSITVQSLNEDFILDIRVLEKEKICGPIPKLNNKEIRFKLQKHNITLTDDNDDKSEIKLLFGADFSGILSGGKIIELDNNIIAVHTKLGWTIQGPMMGMYNTTTLTNVDNNIELTDLWNLETLGIKDPAEIKNKKKKSS